MDNLNDAWKATTADIKALPKEGTDANAVRLAQLYTLHARGLIAAVSEAMPKVNVAKFLTKTIKTANDGHLRSALKELAHDIYERLPDRDDELFDGRLVGVGIITEVSKFQSLQRARQSGIGIIPATQKLIAGEANDMDIEQFHAREFPTLPIVRFPK